MARLEQQIGDRIRTLREGKGWFQEELAKAARLTTRTIGRGEVDVRLSTLDRIAKGLSEPLQNLLR